VEFVKITDVGLVVTISAGLESLALHEDSPDVSLVYSEISRFLTSLGELRTAGLMMFFMGVAKFSSCVREDLSKFFDDSMTRG